MEEPKIPEEEKASRSLNFIEEIIEEDIRTGVNEGRVHTRFPPEPNGYLHIGHAKSICLNFGLGKKYNGKTNLRFDDTNPVKEDVEYVDSIMEDVRWLGFDWEDRLFYASDYFEQLYEYALILIRKEKAYVCDMTAEEISETRGTPTRPGKESEYRGRTVDVNLDLFSRMRQGEFPDGSRVLRAKIDMASLPTCTCAIRCFTVSFMRIITVPVTSGAFTRCMISPTDNLIPSNGSPIQSVPWSLKCTGRFMNGLSAKSGSMPPGKLNLRG